MSEASWIAVSVVNLEIGIILCAIVVGEFEDAFSVGPVLPRLSRFGPIVCYSQNSAYVKGSCQERLTKEIQVELVVRHFDLVDL